MHPDLERILRDVNANSGTAAYSRAASEIGRLDTELQPLRLALLSSFTIDPLLPFLKVEMARAGFAADVYVAPFNTTRQALLDSRGGSLAHQPDVVFLAELLGDVCPALADDYLGLSRDEVDRNIDRTVADLEAALRTFRTMSAARVIVHNHPLPDQPLLGLYEAMADDTQTSAVRRLNDRLARMAASITDVYVLDFERLAAEIGLRRWRDDRMWALARAPYSAPALAALADQYARLVRALAGPPRKCLVLDLDDTLWGGVLGEAGIAGIKLGQTYPGNTYRRLQQYVLQLHRRGILLAINSKNNADEVEDALSAHPDMVLRPAHFTCIRANWVDKPANMVDIARELNIGLDSLVFLDDSPVECALMRDALPDVLTLQASRDPLQSMRLLAESGAFERLSFTNEDRTRGEMYRNQQDRAALARASHSLDQFLAELQMAATVRRVDDFAFPRICDLLQKTNQFNLTTRRHSAGDLRAIMDDPESAVFCLELSDRFGDNGIVGAAIVQRDTPARCRIETFLMSCRVLGRAAETALLSVVADWSRGVGAVELEGEFIPTAKNAPAVDFYSRHGFTRVDSSGGAIRWRLSLVNGTVAWPAHIRDAQLQEAS